MGKDKAGERNTELGTSGELPPPPRHSSPWEGGQGSGSQSQGLKHSKHLPLTTSEASESSVPTLEDYEPTCGKKKITAIFSHTSIRNLVSPSILNIQLTEALNVFCLRL